MKDYPPKPENATHFQRHYGYEPATVLKWEWSTTFGRWGALVRFADGAEIYTYPRQEERPTVPALRIGAPVRVKCHERAGERGIIVSEDRGLFVVRFPDMSTGRFAADLLTVLE